MKLVNAVLGVAGLCFAVVVAACATATAQPAGDQSVRITMTRTVCFGFCPAYTVIVAGDGQVTFRGENFVAVRGEQHAEIAPAEVAELVARFDAAGFDQLREVYRAGATDLPSTTIVLERGGRRKAVFDYGGTMVGMPPAVRALQSEIDRVAGTDRWVLRDGQPVRQP